MIIGDYAYKFWRFLAVAGAVAIFFGAGWFIVTTLPPRELVMATGAEGGANYELGIRYREILAKEGVELQLQRTSGSLENLRNLRDPRSQVSVGFIQGGTTTSKEAPELESLGYAQQYMRYGFTTLRDMGTLDPEWPTVNLRDAIDGGMARGPRLIVAPHMISATADHGDMQGMFPCRCHMGLSRVADSPAKISELVRMEHAFGGNWIKTMNTGGYMSAGDDPARVTWFEDEMQALGQTRDVEAKSLGSRI
jgi:hypothetical protein